MPHNLRPKKVLSSGTKSRRRWLFPGREGNSNFIFCQTPGSLLPHVSCMLLFSLLGCLTRASGVISTMSNERSNMI